jgi:hypothetical protein
MAEACSCLPKEEGTLERYEGYIFLEEELDLRIFKGQNHG